MREKNPEMVSGEKKLHRDGTATGAQEWNQKKTSFANFSEICEMLVALFKQC